MKKRLMTSSLLGGALLCFGLAAMNAHAQSPAPSATVAGVYTAAKDSPDGRHARVKLTLRPDTTFHLKIALGDSSAQLIRTMTGHWSTSDKTVFLVRKPEKPIFTIESAGPWTTETRHAAKLFAHELAKNRAYNRCSFRSLMVELEVSDLDKPIPQNKVQAQAALARAKRLTRAYEKAGAVAVNHPGREAHYDAWTANVNAHNAWLLAKAGFKRLGLKVPEKPKAELPPECRINVQPIAPGSRVAIKFVSNEQINDKFMPTSLNTKLVFQGQKPLNTAGERVSDGKYVAWLFGQSKPEQSTRPRLQLIKIEVTMRDDYTVSVPEKYAHARYFILRYHPERRLVGFSTMMLKIRDNGDLLRIGSSTPLKKQPMTGRSGP